MALMALSPLKIKLIGYAGMIAAAYKKIDEMETIMAKILTRKVGFCPEDVKKLENGLRSLEFELNNLIKKTAGESGQLVLKMESSPILDTGRFAGTRIV